MTTEEQAKKAAKLKEDLHTQIKMLKSQQKKRETEEKYYITVLKMDTATAKKHARFSADKMLLDYIYMM